ncbi:MAG TPA: hypothetical protein VGM16_08665 [Gammaproteobacteria bacterium]|jgi:hypothetical protein
MHGNPQSFPDQASSQVAPSTLGLLSLEPVAAPQRDRSKPIRVVYIAGDGRSGSTLLDRLIGAYSGVFSCGELGNLLQSTTASDQLCACGSRARECGFWRTVLTRWSESVPDFTEREYRSLQRRYERLRSLLRPFNARELTLEDPRFARYTEYTLALFEAISDLSGATVIVDSSKSPARALALSRMPGLEVNMLHLVRDVRGVAYSLRKLSAKAGRGARIPHHRNLRFAGTWAVVNLFCEQVMPKIPGPNLFARYEDYTKDPDSMLTAVANLIGRERIAYTVGADYLLTQGHQVAGNDARMRPVQQISTDETWRNQFGFAMRKGLYLLVLPMMLRYRYRP